MIDRFYNYPVLKSIIIDLVNYDFSSFNKLHDFIDTHGGFDAILNTQNRFHLLHNFIKLYYPQFIFELFKGWIFGGFSPENGLFPAQPYRLPENAPLTFVAGVIPEFVQRTYLLQVDSKHFVIQYGKGHISSESTPKVIWETVLVPSALHA